MKKHTLLSYLWLFLSVFFISLSNIVYKYAALSIESYTINNIFINILFWISFFLFFARLFLWQKVLAVWPISLAYPFMSINIIITYCYGVVIFNDPVRVNHIYGGILIIIGFLLLFSKIKKSLPTK